MMKFQWWRAGLLNGGFNEGADVCHEHHVVNCLGAGVEEWLGADKEGKALGSADRNVESVLGEQEVNSARHVVCT